MLPPRGIVEAPGHVGAARLRGAGPSGIKVTYAQTMRVRQLIIHLSQVLVEVIRGGNIALPSCCASGGIDKVCQGNIVVYDLHRDRIQTVGANYIRYSVADERQVGGWIRRLGRRLSKITGTFKGGGNPGTAQEGTRCLTQPRVREEKEGLVR